MATLLRWAAAVFAGVLVVHVPGLASLLGDLAGGIVHATLTEPSAAAVALVVVLIVQRRHRRHLNPRKAAS